MLKDGTEDGTGEVEDGTAKTGVVKNQDGRCLISGSCACKTPSHFPVENTQLEKRYCTEPEKFHFPCFPKILSFPVMSAVFRTWKLEKCKRCFILFHLFRM